MAKPKIRCAIYTRKSSEEGLEQEFNSLDAQYEACAAYIASQRHEGWHLVKPHPSHGISTGHCYADAGISGGTLERPGLKALLDDISAGRVDRIVVYKIDRLTRALSDFARIVDLLDAKGASFVSVTQSFNTATSMGRLTLNMLLSFAQFEREVTAERIRDKIAASKAKGLWMGGVPPIGYDPHPDGTTRTLVVNAQEAQTVRQLFALYLDLGCLRKLEDKARAQGIISKVHQFASGKIRGGTPFKRGALHKLLTNPIYIGKIRHKDKLYDGLHEAIIDQELWDTVQGRLQAASAKRRGAKNGAPCERRAPLKGKFTDETGDLMTPTHCKKNKRTLRYYISGRLLKGKDPSGWRLPARHLEQEVHRAIIQHLREAANTHRILAVPDLTRGEQIAKRARALIEILETEGTPASAALITRGRISANALKLDLSAESMVQHLEVKLDTLDPGLLALCRPLHLKRRGVEARLVIGDPVPNPDPILFKALREAHHWRQKLYNGTPIRQIAKTANRCERQVARRIPLACLSPKIQTAIVEGTQPQDLTLARLIKSPIPHLWEEQEQLYGLR